MQNIRFKEMENKYSKCLKSELVWISDTQYLFRIITIWILDTFVKCLKSKLTKVRISDIYCSMINLREDLCRRPKNLRCKLIGTPLKTCVSLGECIQKDYWEIFEICFLIRDPNARAG